jgi:hypothetical protein
MGQTAMHTIATVSRKGGTGKSTIAIGLAVAAIEAGHWVSVLEADPLGSVSNWRRRRTSEEPTVETVRDGYTSFHRIPELARRGVTLTIIDTAGGWSEAACVSAAASASACEARSRSDTHCHSSRISFADFPEGAYSVMPRPMPSASCWSLRITPAGNASTFAIFRATARSPSEPAAAFSRALRGWT